MAIQKEFFSCLLMFNFVYFENRVGGEEYCGCSPLQNMERFLEKLVRLEFRIEQLENELATKGSGLFGKVNLLGSKVRDLEEKADLPKDVQTSSVAFSAVLTPRRYVGNEKHPVVFDSVETNTGDAYNNATGYFTAPTNGTYYFFASMFADNGLEVGFTIAVNGIVKVKSIARGTDFRHGTASQAVIVQLTNDDAVNVGTFNVYNKGMTWHGGFCTFSGFLIFQ